MRLFYKSLHFPTTPQISAQIKVNESIKGFLISNSAANLHKAICWRKIKAKAGISTEKGHNYECFFRKKWKGRYNIVLLYSKLVGLLTSSFTNSYKMSLVEHRSQKRDTFCEK